MGHTITVGIGSGFDHATWQNADDARGRSTVPFRMRGGLMAARGEIGDSRRGRTFIEAEVADAPGMIVEAGDEVECFKARRFDGCFRIHAEIDNVEKNLKEALFLVVAARSRKGDIRFAVMRDESRTERDAGALAAGELIRMTGDEQETLSASGECDTGIARDHGRKPSARRRDGNGDAVFLNHIDASGVSRHQVRIDVNVRGLGRGGVLSNLTVDLAGAKLKRSLGADQLT